MNARLARIERLNSLKMEILSEFNSDEEKDLLEKVFPVVDEEVLKSDLDLTTLAEDDNRRIKDFIIKESKKEAFNKQAFAEAFADFLVNLEIQQAEALFRIRDNDQNKIPNIIKNLEIGNDPSDTWGDAEDLQVILEHVITPLIKISKSGTYITPPVGIAISDIVPESLEETIKTVIDNTLNTNANIVLLVPVSSGGHWTYEQIELTNGAITRARLVDSAQNVNIPTFENMQKVIKEISNGKIEVIPEVTGKQENGFSCMDLTIQGMLRELENSGQSDKKLSNELNAICACNSTGEKGQEKLRSLTIDAIIAKKPNLQNQVQEHKDSQTTPLVENDVSDSDEEDAQMTSSAEVGIYDFKKRELLFDKTEGKVIENIISSKIDESEVIEELNETFTKKYDAYKDYQPGQNKVEGEAKKVIKLQKEFDNILAERFSYLLNHRDSHDTRSETELFAQAQTQAVKKFRELFGIFHSEEKGAEEGKTNSQQKEHRRRHSF